MQLSCNYACRTRSDFFVLVLPAEPILMSTVALINVYSFLELRSLSGFC